MQKFKRATTKNKLSLQRREAKTQERSQAPEGGLRAEWLDVESEASPKFRISQMEIEEAVKAKDANYELRQIGRAKKMPGLDRILIEQVFKVRKENVTSVEVYTRWRRRLSGRNRSELSDSHAGRSMRDRSWCSWTRMNYLRSIHR